MKYIVYCTTCLVNGKIYIGVHKTKDPNTFDGYLGCGIEKGWILKNPKTAFQRALKKYGYNKFKRSILYIFDTEKEAYDKEAEIVTKDFIKRNDNYNTSIGGYFSGEHYKWIYRYHLDGSFWEEYLGIEELAEKSGHSISCYREACELKRSFNNSYWSFEKQEKLNLNEYHLNKFSTIYQFDLKGNFIKEWISVKDICTTLDITESNLLSALNKKSSAKGFYFIKDKNAIINILKSKEVYNQQEFKKPGTPIKIGQYDLDNNLIKIWDSVGECSKSFSKCRDVAKGLRKQTKGYIFRYIS